MPKEQPNNKQPAPEYVTIKQAEEKEKERQEKLAKMRKRVAEVADKLKTAGYKFEIEESDEFLIKQNGKTTHLIKLESFPLVSKDKPNINATLEEMIAAIITKPDDNGYDAVVKMRS